MPFTRPLPVPDAASPDAVMRISIIHTGRVLVDRERIVDGAKPEKIEIPVLAFLLERAGKAYLFDMGLRPDLSAVPT